MKLISIVLVTYERPVELLKILISIEKNKYPLKEVIVVDDNSHDEGATKKVIYTTKEELSTNTKYLNTEKDGYNLAMARNMGIIESMGDIIMFLDDRYALDPDYLEKVAQAKDDKWYYGKKRIKGEVVHKRPFIENTSWVTRKTLRKFGMFNERINAYGGQSQDVRERLNLLGMETPQVDAYATELTRSKSNKNKDQIWRMKYLLYKLNH